MFSRYSKDRCYIIAEIGGNFTTLEEAARLIDAATQSGADAVKLQTYRAETLSSKNAMFDMENTGLTSQFDIFKQYEVDEDLHREVFAYAGKKGLDWFSTPSHATDADMLDRLGVGIFKVGSDDACNIPFLTDLARRGKPIMLSTGMCTLDEVQESVDAILGTGNRQLMLLHAITNYPTHPESVNLKAMQTLAQAFPDLDVGYSDHTLNSVACIAAAAMGARILEKHFTCDKNAEGPDHMLSADPGEMLEIVTAVRLFERMKGDGIKQPAASEAGTRRNNRKSIVMERAVAAGTTLGLADIAVKRPGYGIEPKHFGSLVGRTAKRDLAAEEILHLGRRRIATGIIIQARMGSTRLPGKVLKPVGHLPLLGHVVGRLEMLRHPAKILVATSTAARDDAIADWCAGQNIACFRGSETDVLARYYDGAKAHGLDPIVRLTADNPFTDMEELDRLIELHTAQGDDFTTSFAALPIGVGAEIFTFAALERSYREGLAPHHREHVDEYMIENPQLFRAGVLSSIPAKNRPELRLTVDTQDDYRRACFIAENGSAPWTTTEEAIALCSRFA